MVCARLRNLQPGNTQQVQAATACNTSRAAAQLQHPNHKQRLTALVDLVHGGKRVEGRVRVQDEAVHGARLQAETNGIKTVEWARAGSP